MLFDSIEVTVRVKDGAPKIISYEDSMIIHTDDQTLIVGGDPDTILSMDLIQNESIISISCTNK